MSIIALQRTIAEAGRIRIGQQVPAGRGTRPAKLDTFRLTSADKVRIEQAAELYGGEVKPWQSPAGPQWEVITTTSALDVIVPPGAMAFSQFYELWSAGGCQRRCDGQTESIGERACVCDPDQRECDIHTRLSVMLRDLPGLALWRIDTQGWYAARELAGAVDILNMAAGRGVMLPARLVLDQRTVKRQVDGKTQTLRFAVPRLDPGVTPGELLLALPAAGPTLPQLVEGESERPKLLPVPQDPFTPTIAEQSAAPGKPPRRANSAPEIPTSGRSRREGRPESERDAAYWRARTFAAATERGLDTDTVRGIAVNLLGAEAEGFSLSTLDEASWERLHSAVVALATPAPQEPDDLAAAFGGGEPAPAAAPARRPTPATLVARLQELTKASDLPGVMSTEQRQDVFHRVIQPAGSAAFRAVFVEAFDAATFANPTAAQAAAVLAIADLFGEDLEVHAQLWQDAADELAAAVPA